jgi:glutamine amidotransferase
MTIAIIDVQLGNLNALVRCVEDAGFRAALHTKPPTYLPSKVILPGVSSFDTFISRIEQSGWAEWLLTNHDQLDGLLGICVGMQVLFDESEEGCKQGLGLISGTVARATNITRLPNMGWRSLEREATLTEQCDLRRGFYFLHSYACNVNDPSAEVTKSNTVTATVQKLNTFGVQFHPEKSYANGIQLIRNFHMVTQ